MSRRTGRGKAHPRSKSTKKRRSDRRRAGKVKVHKKAGETPKAPQNRKPPKLDLSGNMLKEAAKRLLR